MTAYGIPYLKVCLNCRDEFSPTETSGENEFCSFDCEEAHWEKEEEFEELQIDTAAQVYLEDYGKVAPWLR